MAKPQPGPRTWNPSIRATAATLGLLATLAVLVTIDDPGITIDEPLDVRPGRTYLSTLGARGLGFFSKEIVDLVFRDNAEHPPLGRWLLGLASMGGQTAEIVLRGGPDPLGLYVVSGRIAPSLIFGLMVGLVASTAGRIGGLPAAIGAGLALVFMPRVFAHAHLGALDTFIAYFWTLALISADRALASERPVRGMGLAGIAWALALLTKIHAWLLPPLIFAWAIVRLRHSPGKAVAAFGVWLAVGLSLYVLGWPWLWYDLPGRLARYLGTGVDRITIRTLYFGTVYEDKAVPWHYPWFYFAVTVPVGLHLLGLWGTWTGVRRARDGERLPLLLLASIGMFLLLFSTRTPVYDGERLFLPAFPLWAILIGLGFGNLWGRSARNGNVALGVVLAAQAYGVVMIHPYGLSYYNLLVGGLPGAEKLGLELTYWGDAVDKGLLNALASNGKAGEDAALAPTLAPEQGKVNTTRPMAGVPIILADQDQAGRSRWLIVSRREAYWSPEVRKRVEADPAVLVRSRHGVWLSRLLKRAP